MMKAFRHLWNDLQPDPLKAKEGLHYPLFHSLLLIASIWEHTQFGPARQVRGHKDTFLVIITCSLNQSNSTWYELFKSCGIFTNRTWDLLGGQMSTHTLLMSESQQIKLYKDVL